MSGSKGHGYLLNKTLAWEYDKAGNLQARTQNGARRKFTYVGDLAHHDDANGYHTHRSLGSPAATADEAELAHPALE